MLEVERVGDRRRVMVRGELDAATASRLVEDLKNDVEQDGDLELEMSGVSFVDSTGLRALLQLAKALEGRGTLLLRNPSRNVQRLLDITGVDGRANLRSE